MNIKAMSITLAIAFVVIPFAANASTTVTKDGATVTTWTEKTHGLTKDGYPVMRMFSTISYGASVVKTSKTAGTTGTAIVKTLTPK